MSTPAPQPQPLSESDARMWAMLGHLSIFVIAIIGPLIIMLTLGDRNAFVKKQSVEALNFQITVLIASVISAILIFLVIGIFMLIAVAIIGAIFAIMAAVKSYNGEDYRYPINIRMVK